MSSMNTRLGGKIPVTHSYDTRAARCGGSARPTIPVVDTAVYTDGSRRPAFTSETMKALFSSPRVGRDGRLEYLTKTSATSEGYLPQERDATDEEKRQGAYATIGHRIQWRDYVQMKTDPVLVSSPDGEYHAYRKEDVSRIYNDLKNLELQSQSYNSHLAKTYSGSSPISPEWDGK